MKGLAFRCTKFKLDEQALRSDQAKEARVVSFATSNGGYVGGGRSDLHLKTLEEMILSNALVDSEEFL
jgi:hypothetical protein